MKNLEFAVKSNVFKRIVIIPTMSALNIKGCKDFFKYFPDKKFSTFSESIEPTGLYKFFGKGKIIQEGRKIVKELIGEK